FVFSSRGRHTRSKRDWSSDVCSSDLITIEASEHEALKDKASRLTEAESEVERLRRENEELKAEIAELKRQKAKEARREHVTSVRSEERRVGTEYRSRRRRE